MLSFVVDNTVFLVEFVMLPDELNNLCVGFPEGGLTTPLVAICLFVRVY